MRTIKVLLFVMSTLFCFTGCTIESIDTREYPMFMYSARNANFFWADNIRGETISGFGHTGTILHPLTNDSVVKSAEYILGFNSCNKDITDFSSTGFSSYFQSNRYNPLIDAPYMALNRKPDNMTDEADPAIERIIDQYLSATFRTRSDDSFSGLTRANLVIVDYRLTPLTNLKITASKDIFGITAGNNLNNCFIIHRYPLYHEFIVTADKRLITGLDKVRDISIAQYLSYRPLAPAAMYLRLRDGVAVKSSVTTEFTIELELEGNRTVKATTRPITITP